MISFFYDSTRLILLFVLPGVFLGAVYDGFRILRIARSVDLPVSGRFYEFIRPRAKLQFFFRRKHKKKRGARAARWLLFAEDVAFCLIAALTMTLWFFHVNGGEIRIYGLLAAALGFFAYRQTVGRAVVFFANQIIFVSRCLVFWLFYPFFLAGKFARKQIVRLWKLTVGAWMAQVRLHQKKKTHAALERRVLDAASRGFAYSDMTEVPNERKNETMGESASDPRGRRARHRHSHASNQATGA